MIRTYTVSSSPQEAFYRISVKKELDGLASSFLHHNLKVGNIIEAKAPSGDFFIDAAEKRPAVLLAAGVGITPMISMAKHVAAEGQRTRFTRPLTIFHSAKSTDTQAFSDEFRDLEALTKGEIRYYSFIQQVGNKERPGVDFNGTGHLSANVFRQTLALDDYDFFLCGPAVFMQSMYDTLRELGVTDKRIFSEAFGPASLVRQSVEGNDIHENKESDHALIRFDCATLRL